MGSLMDCSFSWEARSLPMSLMKPPSRFLFMVLASSFQFLLVATNDEARAASSWGSHSLSTKLSSTSLAGNPDGGLGRPEDLTASWR